MMKFMQKMILAVILNTAIMTAHAETSTPKMSAAQEVIELFFAAARTGQRDVINEFLANGFPVDLKNDKGFTALMMATYYGHQDVVSLLLKQGANRCLRDQKGHTALMGAIVKAEWAIAKQLRQVDCDKNAHNTGELTTEEFARFFGQEEKLKQLLESEK